MAETMLRRVSRILSAKLEDVVDRMEQSGSDSVMREAIREVDRAIDQIRDDHDSATARRLQAARQQKRLHEKVGELTEKAKFALSEGREDLAEAALSRQLALEEQAGALEDVQTQAAEDETTLRGLVAALAARKQEMDEARDAFCAVRRGATPDQASGHPDTARRGAERRVHHAEQAFDRAMRDAGGNGLSRADADAIHRVAEIHVMQKRSTVAARLSALKHDAGMV